MSLVAVNQTISQLPEALQAVFGDAGALIVFRVGALDAERLADELGISNASTLTQTSSYQAWIRLIHDGAPMQPRLLHTFPPLSEGARFEKAGMAAIHRTAATAAKERVFLNICLYKRLRGEEVYY